MSYNTDPGFDPAAHTGGEEWAMLSIDGAGAADYGILANDAELVVRPPIVFESKDNNEILPDSIAARDQGIAELCTEVVPRDYQVVMPHTAIATEDLGNHLAEAGLGGENNTPLWVYGSTLPGELFERSTKVQVHEPFDGAEAPDWFDYRFPAHIKETTVPGYSCFSPDSLSQATSQMLDEFVAVRLKNPNGSSGEEQLIVDSADKVGPTLEKIATEVRAVYDMDLADYLAKYGYVLEANLDNVTAWSVTVTQTPDGIFSSFGRLLESDVATTDGSVMREYGGTSSVVVRGYPNALGALPSEGIVVDDPAVKDEEIRLAPSAGIVRAAQKHIEGMQFWEEDGIFRTRANVDVVTGELRRNDGSVEHITASVEDSGRPGGASPAELMGIKELQANPDAPFAVRSSRHSFNPADAQAYADHAAQTPGSRVFWHGNDASWGDKHVFMGVF